MTKRIAAVLAVLSILTACGPDEREDPVASTDPPSYGPGGTVDLNATFGALIGAPSASGVVWAVGGASAAVSAGLSITPGGLLQLPTCAIYTFGGSFPTTIGLEARSGNASGPVVLSVSILVDERFISSSIACYILSGESTCRDPNAGGIVLEAGLSAQFYSRVQTTCTTTWSPALPAGACPADTDPAYAFCW